MVRRKKLPAIKLSLSGLSSHLRSSLAGDSEAWMQSLVRPIDLDERVTARHYRPRLKLVILATGLVFGILALRLVSLQLFTGQRYLLAAEGNRIRDDIAYAPRGTIYDRHGKVLARNSADYQLSVTPYLLERDETARRADYDKLAPILGMPTADLLGLAEAEGISYTLPILVAEHLTHNQMLQIEQSLPEVSGFSVDSVPVREYVADAGLAHVLGYVGRVNKQDLTVRQDILPTDFVGRSGVEQQYDSILRGRNGRSRVEVDALGRPIRLLAQQTAQTGTDITLTIDYDLQVQLEAQLRAQLQQIGATKGSAVMVDPETGEILAMVSIPFYDNNLFARGISAADLKALLDNPDQPMLNKVIGAAYPSASTIKPIISAGALQEGVITDQTVIVDKGYIDIANQYDPTIVYRYKTWRVGGLGPLTVRRALALSSNVFFYTVAGGYGGIKGLGVDRLVAYYRQFGLGEKTGVDLPGETAGLVPDPAWKERVKKEKWFLGDTYNIAVGQGDLKVSPLQLTMATMAVANGGKLLKPHVLGHINSDHVPQPSVEIRRQVPIDAHNLQIVREGMHDMVYHGSYCACKFSSIPVEIAGKTGTAEANEGAQDDTPHHAWFMSFGPWDKPRIGLGVMIEHGQRSVNAINPAIPTLTYYFTHNQP